jgi:hypothetical protein
VSSSPEHLDSSVAPSSLKSSRGDRAGLLGCIGLRHPGYRGGVRVGELYDLDSIREAAAAADGVLYLEPVAIKADYIRNGGRSWRILQG